jgi:hypothetical protein
MPDAVGMSQKCQEATSETWSHITEKAASFFTEETGRPSVLCYHQGDDRRRPNVVVCFHFLDCFDTACRKDGPGARKVVSDLALDSSLCRAIGAAGTPDPW